MQSQKQISQGSQFLEMPIANISTLNVNESRHIALFCDLSKIISHLIIAVFQKSQNFFQ